MGRDRSWLERSAAEDQPSKKAGFPPVIVSMLQDIAGEVEGLRSAHIEMRAWKSPIGTLGGKKVFAVDGDRVKIRDLMDFVEGGNGEVYSFIPKDEIWVDARMPEEDWPHIAFHEAVESLLMSKMGFSYEEAHAAANRMERDEIVQEMGGGQIAKAASGPGLPPYYDLETASDISTSPGMLEDIISYGLRDEVWQAAMDNPNLPVSARLTALIGQTGGAGQMPHEEIRRILWDRRVSGSKAKELAISSPDLARIAVQNPNLSASDLDELVRGGGLERTALWLIPHHRNVSPDTLWWIIRNDPNSGLAFEAAISKSMPKEMIRRLALECSVPRIETAAILRLSGEDEKDVEVMINLYPGASRDGKAAIIAKGVVDKKTAMEFLSTDPNSQKSRVVAAVSKDQSLLTDILERLPTSGCAKVAAENGALTPEYLSAFARKRPTWDVTAHIIKNPNFPGWALAELLANHPNSPAAKAARESGHQGAASLITATPTTPIQSADPHRQSWYLLGTSATNNTLLNEQVVGRAVIGSCAARLVDAAVKSPSSIERSWLSRSGGGLPTWREIQDAQDPDGKRHDLRLVCDVCGNQQTCRCSKPKREFHGICPECAGKRGPSESDELERFDVVLH